jgi:hypothetical protein
MSIDWDLVKDLDPTVTDAVCEAAEADSDGAFILALLLTALQRTPGITGVQVESLLSTMKTLSIEYLASGE